MRIYSAIKNPLYTTGLALGGGAILGAAHIGILRAFEERGIKTDYISGTSIGAFVAALYAFGKTTDEIEEIALQLKWLDISSFKLSKLSLFSNKALGDIVENILGEVDIRDADIPLAIIACDIKTGEKVTLTQGSVSQAVMASASLPGIYSPVEIEGRMLVDGGIAENVPVSAIQDFGADTLIAADLSAKAKYNEPNDVFDVISNAISIAIDNNTKSRSKPADLLITPDLTAKSRTNTDPEEVRHLIEIGYQEALAQLDRRLGIRQWLRVIRKQLLRWVIKH